MYTDFSAFHTFDENKTQISFKPYTKNNDAKTKAFSFTISRNGNQKFGIGIELGEAEALSEFLKFTLTEIYYSRNFSKSE